MAIKAILSFMKKVPVPGEQFSSQSYHCSLETELPTDIGQEEARKRIHETFALVRATVEQELAANGGAKPLPAAAPAGSADVAGGKPGVAGTASNKQVRYILDLWTKRHEREVSELNQLIRDQYGQDGLYGLSKKQASELLTRLKKGGQRAA